MVLKMVTPLPVIGRVKLTHRDQAIAREAWLPRSTCDLVCCVFKMDIWSPDRLMEKTSGSVLLVWLRLADWLERLTNTPPKYADSYSYSDPEILSSTHSCGVGSLRTFDLLLEVPQPPFYTITFSNPCHEHTYYHDIITLTYRSLPMSNYTDPCLVSLTNESDRRSSVPTNIGLLYIVR